MVDMRRTTEEKVEAVAAPIASIPDDYPYGLCLSFDHDTLEKLDLDADCDVGDLIVLRMICRVTSCSQREVNGKPDCRIELQGIDVKVLGEIGDGDEDD